MTKTEDERVQHLTALGINPDGKALAALPPDEPAKPKHQPAKGEVTLAPPGVDPRTMNVDEITFDPHLLDSFPSLEGDGLAAASAYVFSLYKSYTKDKGRNGALHRKITTFITTTRRNRQTRGTVTEQIKTTRADRDIAALIASQGVKPEDLAEALRLLAEKRA